MHQTMVFSTKNTKNFLGRPRGTGPSPNPSPSGEGDTPPHTPHPSAPAAPDPSHSKILGMPLIRTVFGRYTCCNTPPLGNSLTPNRTTDVSLPCYFKQPPKLLLFINYAISVGIFDVTNDLPKFELIMFTFNFINFQNIGHI